MLPAGHPRATYMPYPFQIVQTPKNLLLAYEYASANRVVNMDKPTEAPVDSWMGWSNGKWEGDTLVVDVRSLNGKAWLDRAGDLMTDNAHIVERYTMTEPTTSTTKRRSRTRAVSRGRGRSACRSTSASRGTRNPRVQVRRIRRGNALRPSAQGRHRSKASGESPRSAKVSETTTFTCRRQIRCEQSYPLWSLA